MMNTVIMYDRTPTASYMKIGENDVDSFDEKILLLKKYPGLLPIKKSFQNDSAEYWYDISGMQSLDIYCQIRTPKLEFIEKLILSICSEIEILEKNLVDSNCLILEPETIFINNQNDEIIFTANPGKQDTIEDKIKALMEYMLTKIDHTDREIVDKAYSLYEKCIEAGSNINDLQRIIISERNKFSDIERKVQKSLEEVEPNEVDEYVGEEKQENSKNTIWELILSKLKRNKDTLNDYMISPDEEIIEEEPEFHPTVCLTNYYETVRGILRYEGRDQYKEIAIDKDQVIIGNGKDVDCEIVKETISHFHAKIVKEEGAYYIEDLNSTNGTWVNGEALSYKERRKIEKNDEIKFADINYRFT